MTEETPPPPAHDLADPDKYLDLENLKPGQLPLLKVGVFGKWAFWITAVPFLIYWGGTAFGSYLEKTRKLEPVHTLRQGCRALTDTFDERLDSLVSAEEAAEIRQFVDLPGVGNALDDEGANVGDLTRQCQELLTADLSDLPAEPQALLVKLRTYIEHFLSLEDMVEKNDLDGIRSAHNEFLRKEYDEEDRGGDPADEDSHQMAASWYPFNYSVACIAAFLAILLALPGYLKIPFRVHPLAVVVGVVGIVVWIGLWSLDKEILHIGAMFSSNARAGFNPFDELGSNPTWMYSFIGIRLLGLVIVIPIAEEFFIRGFLMRYIEDPDWDQIPMGMATWKSVVGILVYGAAAHPGEVVAALAWFGLVTWLYLKTKNVWDCVIAHGLTNLLLAVYVLLTKTWELW